MINKIAGYITETGLESTSNGSYYAYFEKIAQAFDLSEEWVKIHAADIKDCLDFDIVAECGIEEDSFSLTFYLQYCCEHCGTYRDGKRCYGECSSCECWCDSWMNQPDVTSDLL